MNNILKKIPDKGEVFLNCDKTVALSVYSPEQKLVVWRLQDEQILRVITNKMFNGPFTFVPNENKFMCVVWNNDYFSALQIYDWCTDSWEIYFDLHQSQTHHFRFSADAKFAFVSLSHGTIFIFDWLLKSVLHTVYHDSSVVDATFTPENDLLFTDVTGSLFIADIFNHTVTANESTEKIYSNEMCDFKWITKTQLALSYSNKRHGVIEIVDYKAKKPLKCETLCEKIWCSDFDPKFCYFATGCRSRNNTNDDLSIIVYDLETVSPIRTINVFKYCSGFCTCSVVRCSVSIWYIYWLSENIIYASGHDGSLHVVQLVDFKYLLFISTILLRCKIAPYIVLDLVNFLLGKHYETSLSLESKLLYVAKITAVEKQLNFLKSMNEKHCK